MWTRFEVTQRTMAGVIASCALAQEVSNATAQTMPAAQDQPVASDSLTNETDPLAVFRAPLLREGGQIVEAKARLQRAQPVASPSGTAGESGRHWMITIDSADPAAPNHEFIPLPCTRLSEMQRIVEASPGRDIVFRLTGQIYVYRNKNYLLPQHAPVLTEAQASNAAPPDSASSSPAVAATPGGGASSAAQTPSKEESGDSAESIMRAVDEAAGPLVRGSSSTAAPASERASSSSQPQAGSSNAAKTLREETLVLNRRGRMTRDVAGAWVFVFDADASGLADPPMKLMPCLLLERIEDHVGRVGSNAPLLISGQVYLYNGRNYLLPTVYRIPRERTKLAP